MPLSSPGEPEQTLTHWIVHTKGIGLFTQLHTVNTKGIGLFTTICLIHQTPQMHCTPILAASSTVTLLAYHSSPPPEF